MGGYGASRIGMKHPDVFSGLYIMSPYCLSARGTGPANPANAGCGQNSRGLREAAL
jgi:S-formylglutathione hydrolase FrmB